MKHIEINWLNCTKNMNLKSYSPTHTHTRFTETLFRKLESTLWSFFWISLFIAKTIPPFPFFLVSHFFLFAPLVPSLIPLCIFISQSQDLSFSPQVCILLLGFPLTVCTSCLMCLLLSSLILILAHAAQSLLMIFDILKGGMLPCTLHHDSPLAGYK